MDEQKLCKDLPDEVWNLIFEQSVGLETDLYYKYVSANLLTKVIAVVSKKFNKLIRRAHLEVESPTRNRFKFFHGSLGLYCCQKGYVSLLKYALGNGSVTELDATGVASKLGHLECLQVLIEYGCKIHRFALDKAARTGRLAVFKYLVEENNMEITDLSITSAVLSGNVQLVEYIRTRTRIDYGSLGSAAAQSGSLAMVKHIEQFAQSKLQLNLSDIGLGGSIEVLQYFLNQGRVLDSVVLCRSASASGHLDFIKFAIQHGAPVDEVVMDKCVQYDDVDLIRMLHARGCPLDITVMNIAAKRGRLEVLKYLVENGCPIVAPNLEFEKRVLFRRVDTSEVTVTCARSGQLNCLQYLLAHQAPCPKDIIRETFIEIPDPNPKCQLAVVKYLHEQGYEWDETATAGAATWGNFELLQYLHQNGCPWDATCCISAAASGQVDCLKYALENGCLTGECEHQYIMNHAVQSGSLAVLRYLFERGYTWPSQTCDILARKGHLGVLRYAHENGACWTRHVVTSALATLEPSLSCIKYAITNGCPWDPKAALATAQARRHKEIVVWLQTLQSKSQSLHNV